MFASACGSDSTVDTGSPDPTDDSGPSTTAPDINSPDPFVRLTAARGLWDESGPTSYVLTTQLQCFCPQTEWTNTIVDGDVVSTESTGEDGFREPQALTMETLFDEVESVINDGYARLDLEFDTANGALLNYWVDIEETMMDEEHGVNVTVSTIDDTGVEAST